VFPSGENARALALNAPSNAGERFPVARSQTHASPLAVSPSSRLPSGENERRLGLPASSAVSDRISAPVTALHTFTAVRVARKATRRPSGESATFSSPLMPEGALLTS
jgi:hypothetical protein